MSWQLLVSSIGPDSSARRQLPRTNECAWCHQPTGSRCWTLISRPIRSSASSRFSIRVYGVYRSTWHTASMTPCFPGRVGDRRRLRFRGRHRLLQQQVVAERGEPHRRVVVHPVLGGDDRGVGQPRRRHKLRPPGKNPLIGYAELRGRGGAAHRVGLGDRHHPRDPGGDRVPGVRLPTQPGADQRERHHRRVHWPERHLGRVHWPERHLWRAHEPAPTRGASSRSASATVSAIADRAVVR
jgi:hypothetical protein